MSENNQEQVLCEDCGQQNAVCTVAVMMGEKVMHRRLCQACMTKTSMSIAAGNLGHVLGALMAAARKAPAPGNDGGATPGSPAPVPQPGKPAPRPVMLPAIEGEAELCPQCGTTYEAFRKKGRPTCPVCCMAFRKSVRQVLGGHCPQVQHMGRRPVDGEGAQQYRAERERLQRQLEEAVAREDYENAAVLRDTLRGLEGREGEGNA